MRALAFRAPLADYELQAADLLAGWRAGDQDSVKVMRHHHPRFLDENITWLPRDLSESELRAISLERADAQLALARWNSFRDWPSLAGWVSAVTRSDSPVARFESAVETVIAGDAAVLDAAQVLVRRGAPVATLAAAAGIGQLAETQRLLPAADAITSTKRSPWPRNTVTPRLSAYCSTQAKTPIATTPRETTVTPRRCARQCGPTTQTQSTCW
jgi:hypothetical protein